MTDATHHADPDLVCAIGLTWGLVSTHRADDAAVLVQACQQLWPDAPEMQAMAAVCGSLKGTAAMAPANEAGLAARWSGLVEMVRARCRLWLGA